MFQDSDVTYLLYHVYSYFRITFSFNSKFCPGRTLLVTFTAPPTTNYQISEGFHYVN